MQNTDPWKVFVLCFSICSFGGLAWILRSGHSLNWRSVFSATLNSGLLGLSIAFLWYKYFQDNPYVLLGMCGLAGLGGITILDFVLQLAKGKVKVSINVEDNDKGHDSGTTNS